MGTTSEKLTYLNTTKSKIKDVINMTDAGITDNTFRSYPQKLYDGYINILKDVNTLVDNMPQNTYTGTSVNIESINGLQPVKTILTKESTQEGTPTPSNPIEIKTIKGYRNLTDTSVGNYAIGSIKDDGSTSTSASNIRSTFYVEVKPNTKYTISTDKVVVIIRFHEFNSSKTHLLRTERMWTTKSTITTRSDTKYLLWSINYDNTSLTDEQRKQIMEDIDLMLIEGEEYTPYVSYNKNFIYEKIIGKNKYNKIYTSWYRNNSIDFDNETTDNNVNYLRSNSFKINGNKTYTISGVPTGMEFAEVRTYNENKEYLGSLNTSTFTLNNNVKYIHLLVDFTNYSSTTNRYYAIANANIQIEEGITATTYEANKDYPTILLNDNEVVGINNNKDELIIDFDGKCKLNKKTAKINSYNGETITTDYMSTTGSLTTGATVYYVLDTPQLIDLQQRIDLSLYDGTNTITNSENADMEIKYIKGTYE